MIRMQAYLLIVLLCFSNSLYVKEVMKSETALCLDGSPSAIFVSKGDPQKILIHFQSGGWCGEVTLADTLESCYQRSKTSIGSSKNLPKTMSFTYGMLSDKAPNYFLNWTRVFFNYCDGSGHQGGSINPIKYKDTQLYFRGENITLQRFDYLEKTLGLYSKTTEVVLSGASAGGLAVYLWGNYLGTKLKNAKYWMIADSGIFLDAKNFTTMSYDFRDAYATLFQLSNQDTKPPTPECLTAYPESQYMCMFAQNLISHIRYPLFIVQSLYDSWAIPYILAVECAIKYELSTCTSEERAFIEDYHRSTMEVVKQVQGLPAANGYWANACVYHGYTFFGSYNSPNFRIPSASQFSIDYSIQKWLTSNQQTFISDPGEWPSNSKCSNHPTLSS